METIIIETTVFGGLPVEVEVNLYNNEIDDWNIISVGGKRCKNVDWVYKKMTKNDVDLIEEKIYNQFFG